MNVPLFFSVLVVLGVVYIWLGQYASKNVRTGEDYFLMGRGLSFWPLFLTLLATQLGGGALIGASQEAYDKGWMVLFYPLGVSLGLFALASGFGAKLRRLNIGTIAEVFEVVYGSRGQRRLASTLSIVTMFMILVAQGISARWFFAALGFESPVYFIAFWALLVTYTVMGGLKAVVYTDALQAVFILAVLALAMVSARIPDQPEIASIEAVSLPTIPWTLWLLMPLLFMLIEQDMGQRCFAAKSPRVIAQSAIAAGVVLLLSSAVAIYFGVKAREAGLVPNGSSSILLTAVSAFTSPTVATLFMVALFLAVISTADSLLCCISSNLACDFFLNTGQKENTGIRRAQLLTFLTGLAALLLAFFLDQVVPVLMFAYELSVCVLFVPTVVAVCVNAPSRNGGYLSMGCGFLGFLLFKVFDPYLPSEVAAVLLSCLGYVLGRLLPISISARNSGLEVRS